MRKYGRKAHTSGLHRDINVLRNFFYHLEDSRSHGNEEEGERARGKGACLPPRAPALSQSPIMTLFGDYAPPT